MYYFYLKFKVNSPAMVKDGNGGNRVKSFVDSLARSSSALPLPTYFSMGGVPGNYIFIIAVAEVTIYR